MEVGAVPADGGAGEGVFRGRSQGRSVGGAGGRFLLLDELPSSGQSRCLVVCTFKLL